MARCVPLDLSMVEALVRPVEANNEMEILVRSYAAMREGANGKAEYVASRMPVSGERTLFPARVTAGEAGSPRNEPQIGTVFAGRYEIQAVLGKGGMGIVYRALDREVEELVAIKTLRHHILLNDPWCRERLKQEIRLARRITHPNVLRTHDLGESNGLMFLSMEFVEGRTLERVIEYEEILPSPVGLRIAKQICAGVAAAHGVGVVHGDIKPQNIIIEPTGRLKIMDFGSAHLTDGRGMTTKGTVIGTIGYMSPEQARGLPVDFRSDIYSTGVVLYEMFTGSLPFEGDTPLAVVWKHVNDPPPLPQKRNPRIDPRIAAVVMKCLAKEARARFQTVGELYEAL